jgi:[ribosomal protein S18]-alanine N-acetyltransferase
MTRAPSLLRRLSTSRSVDDETRLVLEPMTKRHLRRVLDIEEASHPRPWTHNIFVTELDQVRDGWRYYAVAHRGRHLVGYAGLMFPDPCEERGEAHVTNVSVHPDARRTGVARVLVRHLVDEALERECRAMSLEVRVSNDAAISLYRSFGFVPAGVRRRYYENREDALVMWCHDLRHDARPTSGSQV